MKKRATKKDWVPPTRPLEFSSLPPPPRVDVRPDGVEGKEPVDDMAVKEAYLPRSIRKKLGVGHTTQLNEELGTAASHSGYKGSHSLLQHAVRKKAAVERDEERAEDAPEPGSVFFDEPALRKAFQNFDIGKRGLLGAKELRHLFAQMGEVPTDQEIDGMIFLCDLRGEGVVSFEDFVTIFGNPAEELRKVDVSALREVVMGEDASDSGSQSESEEESSGSSSSS